MLLQRCAAFFFTMLVLTREVIDREITASMAH
jgi:hypothetical protein